MSVTIRESRKLVLPLDTVLEALLDFDRRAHGPLARGEVLEATFVSDERGDGIDVAVRESDTVEWRRFDVGAIAAAIIGYCRSKRIPLPYSGVKSLALTREGITFNIENTVNLAPGATPRADLAGRPLRYARGYEPYAITETSRNEVCV